MSLTDSPVESFYFKSDSILNVLDNEEYKILYSQAEVRKIKKGQVIFHEGSTPMGIYIVKEGRVKKFMHGTYGKEHILYICCKGDIMGYHALLAEESYCNSVSAIEDTVISFIPKENFLELLYNSPKLSQCFLKNFGKEFGVLINSITALAQKSVRERLALRLLILNNKFIDNKVDEDIYIQLSRNDLANLVGTAKETLIRLLHDFKDEGLIRTEDKAIVIVNKAGLMKVADFQRKKILTKQHV